MELAIPLPHKLFLRDVGEPSGSWGVKHFGASCKNRLMPDVPGYSPTPRVCCQQGGSQTEQASLSLLCLKHSLQTPWKWSDSAAPLEQEEERLLPRAHVL